MICDLWWRIESRPLSHGQILYLLPDCIKMLQRLGWCNIHDDVIKWKHFPRNWPFVWGIHRSPVNSQHKGQWREALMFSLICARINGWVNNGEAGELWRYRAHCDVIVMFFPSFCYCRYTLKLRGFNTVQILSQRHGQWRNEQRIIWLSFRFSTATVKTEIKSRHVQQSVSFPWFPFTFTNRKKILHVYEINDVFLQKKHSPNCYFLANEYTGKSTINLKGHMTSPYIKVMSTLFSLGIAWYFKTYPAVTPSLLIRILTLSTAEFQKSKLLFMWAYIFARTYNTQEPPCSIRVAANP